MDQEETTLTAARKYVQSLIDRWDPKAHFNCEADTRAHRIGVLTLQGSSVLSLAATGLAAKGILLPLWIAAVFVLITIGLGAWGSYAAAMAQKHAYGERWVRIRPCIEGMRRDMAQERVRTGPFAGKGDDEAAGLLVRRAQVWDMRAWGAAPVQAPPDA